MCECVNMRMGGCVNVRVKDGRMSKYVNKERSNPLSCKIAEGCFQ